MLWGCAQQFNWASTTSTNLANKILGFVNLIDSTTTIPPFAPDLRVGPLLLTINNVGASSIGTKHGYASFLININADKAITVENIYDMASPTLFTHNGYYKQLEISLTEINENKLPPDLFINWYFVIRCYINK